MDKTTVYLEPELKRAIKSRAKAAGVSEAEVIRASLRAAVLRSRPHPTPGLFTAAPFAERADELLAGFGDR